jgi:hypothetical protein
LSDFRADGEKKGFGSIFTGKLSSHHFQCLLPLRLPFSINIWRRYNSNLTEAENSIAQKLYLFPLLLDSLSLSTTMGRNIVVKKLFLSCTIRVLGNL